MKKIRKILIVLVIILIVLFLVNLIRNYAILKDIYNSNEELSKEMSNYYFKMTILSEDSEVEAVTEIYHKDNLYLKKTDFANDLGIILYNSDTKEIFRNDPENSTSVADKDLDFSLENIVYLSQLTIREDFNQVLLGYLLKPITSDKDNYIIKTFNNKYLVNKETKLISESMVNQNGNAKLIFEFEKGKVTDKDVTMPE